MSIWQSLKYFSEYENWGNPQGIDPKLLMILDAYRGELGLPLYVSVGQATSGHSEKSAHYPDKNGISYAVDVFPLRFDSPSKSLLDCFFLATRYPFSGVGLYPYWRYTHPKNGINIVEKGGLHLDTSPYRNMPAMRASGHWLGVPGGEENKQKYLEVTKWNLRTHCLV